MKKLFFIIISIGIITSSYPLAYAEYPIGHDQTGENGENIHLNEFPPSSVSNTLVRINIKDTNIPLPLTIEIIGGKPGEYLDAIIPSTLLTSPLFQHLDYTIQIWDVDSYHQSVVDQYHTLEEMQSILENISTHNAEITSLKSIGKTYQERDIWCLEITDNPGVDEGEPGVLFMGLHHAREWPSLEICLYIAQNLTSQYGIDPIITDLLNNTRLWIIPCVNPDGYYFCHDHPLQQDWRKNRQYYPEYGTYGVDLNRNYAGSCNGDTWGSWGSVHEGVVTHYPSYETYCGPTPFSEYETQAIQKMVMEQDISACISWHTYGELVLWPWGYSSERNTSDDRYLAEVGQKIAAAITTQDGSDTYTPLQGGSFYPTTGDSGDWIYGYGHYVLGKPIFTYTVEACDAFHPHEQVLDQVCRENYNGALILLEEVQHIRNVTPRVLPPQINLVSHDQDGDFEISWDQKNPRANPHSYQLDELTDLILIKDGNQSKPELWNFSGFTTTNDDYYSPPSSYKSRRATNDVSSMTTVYPLPIQSDVGLSFWCLYDITEDWHYAFVEVSVDGRYYTILDTFTGNSQGWVFKQYTLDEYVGQSLYIRFRYTTEYHMTKKGFYVDEIYPVPHFSSIETFSSSITTNSVMITEKAVGDYYYRVRGYNDEHQWGDFSPLKKIRVGEYQNEPPYLPMIDGPTNGKAGTTYQYSISAIDPQEDDIYFMIDWGDDTSPQQWIGPYHSGQEITLNHTYTDKGTYTISLKAKDSFDAESDWATLEVRIPHKHLFSLNRIHRLITILIMLLNLRD